MSRIALRTLLASSAYLPAAAIVGLASPAQAQSVCQTDPSSLLSCTDPTTLTTTATGTVTGATVLSGNGLAATSATNILANVAGSISTNGDNQPAMLLNTPGLLTLVHTTGTLSTLGNNADGANLVGGTINATLNDITTRGLLSQGADVTSTNGPLSLTVNDIATAGDSSTGALLRANGNVTLHANTLQTLGINSGAIDIATNPAVCVTLAGGCSVTATANQITTNGLNSPGALITAQGPTSVSVGNLQTLGDSSSGLNLKTDPTACVIIGAGNCGTTFNVGTLSTAGIDSIGALVNAAGPTSATVGVLQTSGDRALGLDLVTDPAACVVVGVGGCATSFNVGNLTTSGADATGVLVRAVGPITGSVDVLQTSGDRALGLDLATDPTACAIIGTGSCGTSFTIGQLLSTQGVGATGALVRAAGPTTGTVNVLQTSGDNANGIDIAADPAACAIVGAGLCDVGLTANRVTTSGNQAAAVIINAPANITAALGDIVTSGDNSPGVSLITNPALCLALGAGSCRISDTTGSVNTGGDNSPGTVVRGGDDPIDVTVGPTNTTGNNSPGIDVSGTGPIAVDAGPVVTSGDDSPGIIVTGGTMPVGVVCASVQTSGARSPGVVINAQGQIDLNCQSVTTTGGPDSGGIIVNGGAGPVGVTVGQVSTAGATSGGITVGATTGAVTVNAGSVITTGAGSNGITTATTTGAQTIVSGGVNASGLGSDGIHATASGCADIDISANGPVTSVSGSAILANTQCHVAVTTNAGATLTGGTSGINVTSGTGATINLGAGVSASNGPAILAAGGATTVNVGTAGSITGAVVLGAGDDTTNNGGTFDVVGNSDFGAGTDVFNNSGTVRAASGTAAFNNLETFNNAGLITLQNGAATDAFTVCGDYVGTAGARLAVDVSGSAASGLAADRFNVCGNASGSTAVNLNLLPGSAVIDADGVIIASAGSYTGTPFTLAPTRAGFIDYTLQQNGSNTLLVSRPNALIFDVGGMTNMARESWYHSSDAFNACTVTGWRAPNRVPLSICAQLYGGEERTGSNNHSATIFGTPLTYSDRLKTKYEGAQVNVGVRPARMVDVGVTAGYQEAHARLSSGSRLDLRDTSYGAYARFGQEMGFYGAVLAKRDRLRSELNNGSVLSTGTVRGRSTGVDGQLGYRLANFGPVLDLSAGLSSVRTRINDFTAGNIGFSSQRFTSTRGRLAARLGWSGKFAPFVDAKLFHEFKDGGRDALLTSGSLSDTIEGRGRGTWGRLEAGLGGVYMLSGWVDVGRVKGWGLRGGFHF